MRAQNSYDYAVIRVVPRVEREEFINAGVIVFSKGCRFLRARVHLDENRLRALSSSIDIELIRRHLDAIPRIAAGESDAGPIAQLSQRERFHWLVSPKSTMLQVSAVHGGMCENPDARLDELFEQLVLA